MSVSGQSAGMALLLREGIDWVALVGSGAATREDHEGLMRWRALSPDHDAAWREAWALGHVMREVGRELIKEREAAERSEERREGKECVSTGRGRWAP